MTIISRRVALRGLALVSATGVAAVATGEAVTAGDSILLGASAIDRLQHHLIAAAEAANELCPEGFWSLHMQGKAGSWRPTFVLFNFTGESLANRTLRQVTVCQMKDGGVLVDRDGQEVA